jgi:hypothetical protein
MAIYRWGCRFQDHFLKTWLGPMVAELKRERVIQTFWFDRFDARGPHLSVVFTLADASISEATQRVFPSLTNYLAAFPSTDSLSPSEVAGLHKACRGKMQSEADRLPGLAENDTFLTYEHPSWDFPFSLSQSLSGAEEIWALVDDLSARSIAELATDRPTPTKAAVRWLAATNLALHSAGLDAADYWRYHASTLLLPLKQRLAAEEECILTNLPGWIGEANRKQFEPIFDEVVLADEVWPHLPRLVQIASSREHSEASGRWALLREIQHSTLKQLGLGVSLHIPLILFAWSHSLTRSSLVASSLLHVSLEGSAA